MGDGRTLASRGERSGAPDGFGYLRRGRLTAPGFLHRIGPRGGSALKRHRRQRADLIFRAWRDIHGRADLKGALCSLDELVRPLPGESPTVGAIRFERVITAILV